MRSLVLAALLLVQAAAPTAQSAVAPHPSVRAQADPGIVRLFTDYFAAVENGDTNVILSLIDDDFVLKWPVGQPISDRTRLANALTSMQQHLRQDIDWQILETHVGGNWAWARVAEKATHYPIAGGPSRTLQGSHLTILKKSHDRWLIHRDYSSLNELPALR